MILKEVGKLKIGDLVMGTDGKPHRITDIGRWDRGSRFLSVDGKPDGVMFSSDLVEVVERPQEAHA
jgi:hypothetical protein